MAAAFLVGLALVAVVVRAFTLRTVEVVTPYQQTQGRIAARLAPTNSATTSALRGAVLLAG
ncbi:MAG: hypothetical protein JO281_02160 [Pseudonocardiales bacterium]|nr:hypothetical protein [Pseudonocardiales bacterium]